MLLLKNLLFTVVVPGTVAVYLPLVIAGDATVASGVTLVVAVLLLAVGASVYASTVWDFAAFGSGTPAPIDAPKHLVVRHLYQYTRNPMYVGVVTVILGWTALFRALDLVLYSIVVAGCFNLFIRLYEEPHLKQLFGQEYEDYCVHVDRWLPRPGRRRRT